MLNISLVAYTYLSRIHPLLNCYFVIHNIEMYFPAMKDRFLNTPNYFSILIGIISINY